MQMRDSDILFFHELFDNLKTYVDKQADLEEKIEDLKDTSSIQRFEEGSLKDYRSARDIDKLF